jgi:hypothetical protein
MDARWIKEISVESTKLIGKWTYRNARTQTEIKQTNADAVRRKLAHFVREPFGAYKLHPGNSWLEGGEKWWWRR